MPKGPRPQPPIFDLETALAFCERYLHGETYKSIGESIGETPRRVERAMKQHGVITPEVSHEHWVRIMADRRDRGVRLGRKPKPPKKK